MGGASVSRGDSRVNPDGGALAEQLPSSSVILSDGDVGIGLSG
jgi:hypothetical protein